MNARDATARITAWRRKVWRGNVPMHGDPARPHFIMIANHEAQMGNYVERIKRNIEMNVSNFARDE